MLHGIKIGGVATWAQFDTGYDDGSLRSSIEINDALYDRLMAAGVPLHWDGDLRVSTCNGFATRQVYDMPDGEITLRSDDGHEILKLTDAKFIRKTVNACGGIANLTTPAAQLGASVIARLGSVVFDPKSEIVWVHPAEQRTALP
jgi:hypothetical protein